MKGGEFCVDAADAADEGDERGQLGERRGGVWQLVEAGVGVPDAERSEARGIGLDGRENLLDLGRGDFLAALGLLVVER